MLHMDRRQIWNCRKECERKESSNLIFYDWVIRDSMNLASEKEFYSDRLEEVAMRVNAEHFLWGEELIDRKLILYAKKLK